MRIVGGRLRGRALAAPKSQAIRPTADRLREVESLVLEDNVVQWMLSQAKTQDKPADFDELKQRQP